jgi:hypothetical protein
MRHIFLILLILFASMLTACSYSVEFVVVNESDRPIEVRCKIVNLPGNPDPAGITGPLSTANASQLRAGDGSGEDYLIRSTGQTLRTAQSQRT